MLGWHLWLSTHLFSLGKCDATQFLHHIGRLATAPANLQPSSRLQPMHPWSPPQLGHPWALSSSGMWANMIKASVTTAHLSYRFPILKLPPPPCAVLLVTGTGICPSPLSQTTAWCTLLSPPHSYSHLIYRSIHPFVHLFPLSIYICNIYGIYRYL